MEKITKDSVMESVKKLQDGLAAALELLETIKEEEEAHLNAKAEAAPESLTQFIDHYLDGINYHKDDREDYFNNMKEAIKLLLKKYGYSVTSFMLDGKLHTYKVSVNTVGVRLEEQLDGGTEPKHFYYEFSYADQVELGIVPEEQEEKAGVWVFDEEKDAEDACYEEHGADCYGYQVEDEVNPLTLDTNNEEPVNTAEELELVGTIVDTQIEDIRYAVENIKEEIEGYFGIQKLTMDELVDEEFELLRTYLIYVTEEDVQEALKATNKELVLAWNMMVYRKMM